MGAMATGFTLRRCQREAEVFEDPVADAFQLGNKVYTVLGYHHIREKAWICLEDVDSLERRDVMLDTFQKYYAEGLFHEVDGLVVLAHIGRIRPPSAD